MPDVTIDWVGIVVAVVAAMVIGGLWYGPLFGASWAAYTGKSRQELRARAPIGYGLALLGAFLSALILTYVTQWAGAGGDYLEGVAIGAVMWLGFVVPRRVTGGALEAQPWGHVMLDAGNALAMFMVVGGIVAAFA